MSGPGLSFSFDAELNEVPADPGAMTTYAEQLLARAEERAESTTVDWAQVAKGLGLAGVFLRMTGRFDEAEKALTRALGIIETHDLPELLKAQQQIRLYHVYQRQNRFNEALEGMDACVRECAATPDLEFYLDFSLQHLGKVHFAMGNYADAAAAFGRALELRLEKGNAELIASTRTALEAALARVEK